MILIDKRRSKFLRAGREVTITTTNSFDYRKGRVYAAGETHNHTKFRVQVVEIAEGKPGERLLTVKISNEEPQRFLGRSGGYVPNPAMGLRDEPAAVDGATQARLTEVGTLKWAQDRALRQAEQDARSLRDRLGVIELAHNRGEFDASRQLAAIRRRIEALEAKRRAA